MTKTPTTGNGSDNESRIRQIFQDHEDAKSPLDGLLGRAREDPGAPLEPETIAQIIALKAHSPAAFERLRAGLKSIKGIRIGEFDKTVALAGGFDIQPPKQADILIELTEGVDLFHTPDGVGYADIIINGHRETWPIRRDGFKRWLRKQYFDKTDSAPNSEALQSALGVIEAQAHFGGEEREVHIRVAGHDGKLYLDLADAEWNVVEIGPDGWEIVTSPPVRFRRSAGMLTLPAPERGGSINGLRQFLNIKNDRDFILVTAWVLAVLRNCGPYPVLVLSGEQGSAKSTFSKILKLLLDPNTAPDRTPPRDARDLFIAANNGHMLCFDNVSSLPAWLSDILCRLSTGGGFSVRQLYTDQDEVLFDAERPIILNGIEDIVTRPDLADRALFLNLEPIPEEARQPEGELWPKFNAARQQLLGALLDGAVIGLRELPKTKLERHPRMADFAVWATACEVGLWKNGTFMAAYDNNRSDAIDSVIEADPVASAIRSLMRKRSEWEGTPTEFLKLLSDEVGEAISRNKAWPSTATTLGNRIRRAATFLRTVGIEFTDWRENNRSRTRMFSFSLAADWVGKTPSEASEASEGVVKPLFPNNSGADAQRTVADAGPSESVRNKSLKTKEMDGVGALDAEIPTQSGSENKTHPDQDTLSPVSERDSEQGFNL